MTKTGAMILRFRIGAGAGILLLSASCSDSMCANTVLQDIPSPDNRRHAVVFERNCGATTDFSTQVSILTRSRSVSGQGNVFVADADHGKAPRGARGGPVVRVRWADARAVEIQYDSRARVFHKATRHDDTEVRYTTDSAATSRPK